MRWVLGITATFLIVEVVGGYLANSLALLADAGHMFTDVGALALSLVAMHMAQRPPSPTKTYGYVRLEILAALVNGATLLVIARFHPEGGVGAVPGPTGGGRPSAPGGRRGWGWG